MRILLSGASGQVGSELFPLLAPLGEVIAPGREQFDLENPDSIVSLIREVKPGLIINTAAYTAVDKAESEPGKAVAINGQAPGILAEEAKRLGALLVHYSTDYVFDGSGEKPWREEDPTAPLNRYGQTKRQGEEAVMAAADRWLIFRTSWVYGLKGQNFLRTMLRLGAEKQNLRVVDDQIGAPTWSRDIARATLSALGKITPLEGLYHLCNGEYTSWAGFARRIMAERSLPCRIDPISSAEYPLPAARPRNSRLDTTRLAAEGIQLEPWDEALRTCLAEESISPG